MRTIRIYQSGDYQAGETLSLDKAASNHLLRVLRLKDQQALKLFNGDGQEYTATLQVDGKRAIAHIKNATNPNNESPINIHLYQGISKGERMDFAIQKSVELGVNSITPIICERTVVNLKGDRLEKKIAHWQGIAISACEQSGRCVVPEINTPVKFSQLLGITTNALRITLDPLSQASLKSLKPLNKNIQILIGPEGGLSAREIEEVQAHDFYGVTLGPRILRTETAALTAITSAQLLWGDLS